MSRESVGAAVVAGLCVAVAVGASARWSRSTGPWASTIRDAIYVSAFGLLGAVLARAGLSWALATLGAGTVVAISEAFRLGTDGAPAAALKAGLVAVPLAVALTWWATPLNERGERFLHRAWPQPHGDRSEPTWPVRRVGARAGLWSNGPQESGNVLQAKTPEPTSGTGVRDPRR